ncbi:unnamed protein product, partial [Linum tenue]
MADHKLKYGSSEQAGKRQTVNRLWIRNGLGFIGILIIEVVLCFIMT